jgi:hypothetical protein
MVKVDNETDAWLKFSKAPDSLYPLMFIFLFIRLQLKPTVERMAYL